MKWLNGLKKGFRYVLLSLCILGVVLQPVSVFAALEYTGAIGYNCVPYSQAPSDVLNFIAGTFNNLPSAFSVENKNFVIQYNSLSGVMYVYVSNANRSELLLFAQTTNNSDKLKFFRDYSGAFQAVTVSCYSYSTPMSSLPSATTRADLITNNPNDLWYLILSPTAINQYRSSLFVEGSGSGSGGTDDPDDWDPDSPTTYTLVYDPNLYYQIGLMLSSNFNCYTPDGSTHFNPNWIGVGQALTYDYLCKTHKENANVSLTLADGSTVSLSNYLYGDPDYTQNLADISGVLGTINSRVNTTNTRLNTINTSINNQLNTVNNKLNAAFPSDQAAINDFIAEDLMDDTDGKGLTISKIANTKSVLDEGVDTFEVDSSGITWTDPFSALLHLDWAWFSETTAINLQAQDQASLLNDIDYSGLQYYNSVNSYYDDGH